MLKNTLISLFLGLFGVATSATFTVDAPGKLATISNQVVAAGNGTHHIRFKTYSSVGTFVAGPTLSADSIIFERDSESAEVIDLSGTFIRARGCASKIVVRGLAFRFTAAASNLLDGSSLVTDSANKSVLLDSIVAYGDSTVVAVDWRSKPGAAFRITNCILSGLRTKDTEGFRITSDSILLDHNFINYPALFTLTTSSFVSLTFNTINRAQFSLAGNGSGSSSVIGNLFAFPPKTNRLPGGTKFYPLQLYTDQYSSIGIPKNNAVFNSWEGVSTPNNLLGQLDAPLILSPFGDSLAQWSFSSPGDTVRGYSNPLSTSRFPKYSIYPGEANYTARLGNDSVIIALNQASIPRIIGASLKTIPYPTILDSTRSYWLSDTSIQVTGPTQIQSITFPNAQAQGRPVLFSQSTASFAPGAIGVEGAKTFANADAAAKVFIPSWGGQNTRKGRNRTVLSPSLDTSIIVVFDSIIRTGNTTFGAVSTPTVAKRERLILKGSSPFGASLTTNATGADSCLIGIGKASTSPFIVDSLQAIGAANASFRDSVGKYWFRASFASAIQIGLLEKLALGKGADSLALTFGKVVTTSAVGHQLRMDTSFEFDTTISTTLARPTKGSKFSWPGRASGDSFLLTLSKTEPTQKAFAWTGSQSTSLTPSHEDSLTLALPLGLGDTTFPIFLARQYSIASKSSASFRRGTDSVSGLISDSPGELFIDTLSTGAPASSDTLAYLSGRRIKFENLRLSSPFSLALPINPDSSKHVRVFARTDTVWSIIAATVLSKTASVQITQSLNAIAIFEIKPKPIDTTKIDTTKPDTSKPDTNKVLKAFSVRPDTLFLVVGGPSGEFTSTFDPKTLASALKVTSRDTSIAKVVDGKIVASGRGQTVITVQVEITPAFSDSIIAVISEISKPDSLAVTPAKEPIVSYAGETITLKPSLSDSETVKLKGYTVTTTTLSISGAIQVKTSTMLTPKQAFDLVRDQKGYQQVAVTYEALNGRVSLSKPIEIIPSSEGLVAALNAMSVPLKARVWHLLGFPRGGSIETDVQKGRADALVQVNSGRSWVMPSSDRIEIGGAVLAHWTDKSFAPAVPTGFSWSPVPDTIKLHQGWNLLSSPLPFAIPEDRIAFDANKVGYFHALQWDGIGPTAKKRWVETDTLKPFQGYAVWASEATPLIFDVMNLLAPSNLKKRMIESEIKITLSSPSVGRSSIWIRDGVRLRASPRPSFSSEDAGIDWDPNIKGIDTKGVRLIRVVSYGASELDAKASLPSDVVFEGLHAPQESRGKYPLVEGENWFLLGSKPSIQKLKGSKLFSSGRPTLLFGLNPALILPFATGTQKRIDITVSALTGQLNESQTMRDVAPGEYPLALTSCGNKPCAVQVRFSSGGVRAVSGLVFPQVSK